MNANPFVHNATTSTSINLPGVTLSSLAGTVGANTDVRPPGPYLLLTVYKAQTGAANSVTVQVEGTVDGGTTWVDCGPPVSTPSSDVPSTATALVRLVLSEGGANAGVAGRIPDQVRVNLVAGQAPSSGTHAVIYRYEHL